MLDPSQLFKQDNKKCTGCSILNKNLTQHSIMDYEYLSPSEILFVSDSLKIHQGEFVPFRPNEFGLIKRKLANLVDTSVAYSASVKCPNIGNDDISTKDRKICRSHLEDTINVVKPKLVFACGSLATRMFYGRSTDLGKVRGDIVDMDLGGHQFKLVSILHPYQVIAEPKNDYLFSLDIENSINLIINNKVKESNFDYLQVFDIATLNRVKHRFLGEAPIAIDIETTGLNFLEDLIHTISLSVVDDEGHLTIAIPVDHKEAKATISFKSKVFDFIQDALSNTKNRKILQNCKFDLKFLMRYGVSGAKNVFDTKLMQHCYREEIPKSLRDLVNYYFPNETI